MAKEEVDSLAEYRAMQAKTREALDTLLEHLGDPDWIVFCGRGFPGRFEQADGSYKTEGEPHIGLSICHACAPDKMSLIPATWHDVRIETDISQYLCETHKAC